jgi:hypothetical protein
VAAWRSSKWGDDGQSAFLEQAAKPLLEKMRSAAC